MYFNCGNFDSDTCLEWGTSPLTLSANQRCENNQIITPCTNDCSSGQIKCYGPDYMDCANYDADTCLDWSPPKSVPSGKICTNNQLITAITQINCNQHGSYGIPTTGVGTIIGKSTYPSNNPPTPNSWNYDTTATTETPCKWKCDINYEQSGNICKKSDTQSCKTGDDCINDCIGTQSAITGVSFGICGKCSDATYKEGRTCSANSASLSDIPSNAGICAYNSNNNLICSTGEIASDTKTFEGGYVSYKWYASCANAIENTLCDQNVFDTSPPYSPDGKCVSGKCQKVVQPVIIKPTISITKDPDGICKQGETITITCPAKDAFHVKVWVGECHGSDYLSCSGSQSWNKNRRDAFVGKDDTYLESQVMTESGTNTYTKTFKLDKSLAGDYIAAACQAYGGSDYSYPSDWADAYPYCKVEAAAVAKLALNADCTSAPNNCDTNLYCTTNIPTNRRCCNTGQKWVVDKLGNGKCTGSANCDITINNVPTKPENRIINAIRNAANYIKGGKTSMEQISRMREKSYGTVVGCSGDQVCCKANYGGVESYDCVDKNTCIKAY